MISLLKLKPYTGDVVVPSPNHGTRRAPVIHGIVLHATADKGDETRSLNWLRSRKSRASCHMVVGRDGGVTRLVGDQQRAWHAGRSEWRGTSDVNSITLGIEIANRNDGEPYTAAQYQRVADIVAHYCRQGLALEDVISHGEIATGRKTDPYGWDWDHFRGLVRQQLHAAPAAAVTSAPSAAPARAPQREVPVAAPKQATPPARPRGKPAVRSRTLWLNGLTVIAAGSVIVGEILDLAFRVGLSLPEEITMWALFGVGVINIVLRFQTTCPVGGGESAGQPAVATAVPVPARAPGRDLRGVAVARR